MLDGDSLKDLALKLVMENINLREKVETWCAIYKDVSEERDELRKKIEELKGKLEDEII